MEDYDKIKKTLAIAFMNDLDANRPEGKMCLSNGECADIEKAFNEQDWPKLERYLDKYTESEDERIRKTLIAVVNITPASIAFRNKRELLDSIAFRNKRELLDLLEKQNHDGKKWIYEDEYYKDLDRCFNDGKDEVLENPGKYGLQKEQKPAEKQDYSGLNDSERAVLRGFLSAGVENVPVGIIKETAKDCIAHFPWPTKWSEDDEKMSNLTKTQLRILQSHLSHTHSESMSDIRYSSQLIQIETCASWLDRIKFLRPQPKQEWSEEDKQMQQAVVNCIDQLHECNDWQYVFVRNGNTTRNIPIGEVRKWVESLNLSKQEWSEEDENNLNKLLQWDGIPLGLRSWISGLPEKVGTRPSWKPSERQLTKLYCIAEGIPDDDDAKVLKELYEQLKKL